MKLVLAAVMTLACVSWLSAANAAEILTHKRTVEYKIVESCGIVVAEGEAVLEWADCKGAYQMVTLDYEDYGQPLSVLFYVGQPDIDGSSDRGAWALMCHKAKKCAPDVYCAECSPCEWYYFRTAACWAGDEVEARAYLPDCMAFEIVDVY